MKISIFLLSAFCIYNCFGECDITTSRADTVTVTLDSNIANGGYYFDKEQNVLQVTLSGGSINPDVQYRPLITVKESTNGSSCKNRFETVNLTLSLSNPFATDAETMKLKDLAIACAKGSNSSIRSWVIKGSSGTPRPYTITTTSQRGVVNVDLRSSKLGALGCN